jgi:hypothetical protein
MRCKSRRAAGEGMLLKAELPSIATCTPAPAVGHAQHHGRKLTDTFHAAAETALPCPRLPVVTTMLAEGRPRSAACKLHRDINNISYQQRSSWHCHSRVCSTFARKAASWTPILLVTLNSFAERPLYLTASSRRCKNSLIRPRVSFIGTYCVHNRMQQEIGVQQLRKPFRYPTMPPTVPLLC